MTYIQYKLTAEAIFPEGIALGGERQANSVMVETNGLGQPIMRGSALSGVLRQAYANLKQAKTDDDIVSKWFGKGLSDKHDDADNPSKISIADAIIQGSAIKRTHNQINRHTGAVEKGALFSIHALPPQVSTTLSITIKATSKIQKEASQFINDIANLLNSDLTLGGNSNRGIGRLSIKESLYLQTFDTATLAGASAWLDANYKERQTGISLKGEPLKLSEQETTKGDHLKIELELGIPRGEDILIGDGQAADYALQPQQVMFATGENYWRIPGSSLRGIIRNWMTRLVARGGSWVADSVENYQQSQEENEDQYNADELGWGFQPKDEREQYKNDPISLQDPVLDLFGSFYSKSRIHITDAFMAAEESDVQERMHVAIDRISGGANDGALFKNQILSSNKKTFKVTIKINNPNDDEIAWLITTLRAIHIGILLIGSSKSSGRLEIKNISAQGEYKEHIEAFKQEIQS